MTATLAPTRPYSRTARRAPKVSVDHVREDSEEYERVEPPQLGDRALRIMQLKRLSRRTQKTYRAWMKRFYDFHGRRHPRKLGPTEITEFLSHLATDLNVAPSTQNQALCALVFLYRHVFGEDFPWLDDITRAKRKRRLPAVLSRSEVRLVLDQLPEKPRLMASLLYGSGLRLIECCQLRVKDLHFQRKQLIIRGGKGDKDRLTLLPDTVAAELRVHLEGVRAQHTTDLRQEAGWVKLPHALNRKLGASAREWPWQWVFPATRIYQDRDTGQRCRHHLHETVLQKAVKQAARECQIPKRVTCHTFRHSFATHLLEDGYDIRTLQALLGHKDVSTTMIYTHIIDRGPHGVRSPLDH